MPDRLSAAQRSYCMSRIKGADTSIEVALRRELTRRGLRYRKNLTALPGRPDIVFASAKLAVFVDGDFWHGYRYPQWTRALSPYWKAKIEHNRKRDRRNFASLRRHGWRVVRIWEHEIKADLDSCASRIVAALRQARSAVRLAR